MGPWLTIFGVLGNVVSAGLILAPLPTIWKILQKRSTEKFSPLPYAAIMLTSLLWLFYGSPLVKFRILVETITGFGVGMEAAFLIIFFVFASDRKTRVQVIMLVTSVLLFVAMVVSLTMAFVQEVSRRKTVVGVISAIVAVLMYASPLSIMLVQRTVLMTKSTTCLPFLLAIMAFLNAALWGSFAILGHDLFIMIPSVLGAGLGVVQLGLYACYCRRRYGEDDDDLEAHKLACETIDSFTDPEIGLAPGKTAGGNMTSPTCPELGQAPNNVDHGDDRNGHTDSEIPLSPASDKWEVDRS
ncbi:unnamed protein product [Calypogeia fissa]